MLKGNTDLKQKNKMKKDKKDSIPDRLEAVIDELDKRIEELNYRDEKLVEIFEYAANEYATRFAEKQEIEFDYWIGVDNQVGSLASFSESYFFSMENIRLDIDNNIPKGMIIKWYDRELYNNGLCQGDINYFSFLLANGFLKKTK